MWRVCCPDLIRSLCFLYRKVMRVASVVVDDVVVDGDDAVVVVLWQ